jgi:hypothetical protein
MSTDDSTKPTDQLTSVSTPAEQVKEPVGVGIWDTPAEQGQDPRTDVHTSEEVESLLTGKAGFDPSNYEGPSVDSQGAFEYKPNVVHADGLNEQGRDWEPPGNQLAPEYPSGSPAEGAALDQGDLASYAATDYSWKDDLAYERDRVWFKAAEEHPDPDKCPPDYIDKAITGYGVPEGGLPGGWTDITLDARTPWAAGTDQSAVTGDTVSVTESVLDAQKYNQSSQIRPLAGEYCRWLHCYEFKRNHAVATGIATENTQYGEGGTPQMYIPDVKDAIGSKVLVYVGQVRMTNTSASDRVKYR